MSDKEEITDEELQRNIFIPDPSRPPRIGATMMGRCDNPECSSYGKKNTPVAVDPVRHDDQGLYEWTTCPVCGGSTKIYGGKHGEDFQANFDASDRSE